MPSSAFSRVAALGALTAAGQIIMVGTLPTYSRLFDPGPYGEYVIFVGTFTVLSVLAGVRYDSAIVLPRRDSVAVALSALVMLIALAVSVLIALATVGVPRLHLTPRPLLPAERDFGLALAVATTLGALQRCLVAWCVRRGRFLRMGWAQFVFCLVTVVAQLALVTRMAQLPALVWGFVCALAFQALCLAVGWIRAIRDACAPANAWRAISVVARKYRRFPTYMVGYALASSARDRLIQIVLGIESGAAVVGRFGLAYRVIFAPNSLIYSAVSPVFYGIASRGNRLAVGRFAAGLVEAVFVLLLVPYVVLALEAPTLTDAVLSEKWHHTGPYLQALAGPALMLAATCWLDRAFDAFRRQNVAFTLEASFTVAAVALVAALARFFDPVAVVWAFGTLALVYYWIYFLLVFLACRFDLADFRRACVTGLTAAVAAVFLGLAAHRIPEPAWRVAAYAGVMGCVMLLWIKVRGGTGTLRGLIESRVHAVQS